jgi:hypothetical protein
MLQQCSTGFVQFFFKSHRFLVIFGGHNQALERIDKPAVPKGGYAEFNVQVFTVRAGHHERRIMENREMGKRILRNDASYPYSADALKYRCPVGGAGGSAPQTLRATVKQV